MTAPFPMLKKCPSRQIVLCHTLLRKYTETLEVGEKQPITESAKRQFYLKYLKLFICVASMLKWPACSLSMCHESEARIASAETHSSAVHAQKKKLSSQPPSTDSCPKIFHQSPPPPPNTLPQPILIRDTIFWVKIITDPLRTTAQELYKTMIPLVDRSAFTWNKSTQHNMHTEFSSQKDLRYTIAIHYHIWLPSQGTNTLH